MKSSRFRVHPSWIIVLAGVSAALHVGKLPPALPVLQVALGISLVQAGFLMSLVQMAGMALGLLVGLGADSLGLRRCMLVGLAVALLNSMLRARCVSPMALVLMLTALTAWVAATMTRVAALAVRFG